MKNKKNMVETDGVSLNFTDAIEAFKFDQRDKQSQHFHGALNEMMAVDVVAVFKDKYVFVEICNKPPESADKLIYDLKYKYRDSFLYRYAQNAVDKPIEYICLINKKDRRAIETLTHKLRQNMPLPQIKQWERHYVKNCSVIDIDMWNKRYGRGTAVRVKKTKR